MTTTTTTMSSSPPPQPQTTPPPPTNIAQNEDPILAALRAMFPDYDDLILQSVLQSSGGNQDRAIDTLLGMSDPEYRSDQPQPGPNDNVNNPAPVLTQEELDEQFARQLVLAEQQQQNAEWLANNQGRTPRVNYATRPGSGWNPPQQSQQNQGPSEFQEQFAKIAETGKKTFGSLFSKVKAKIQEFETGKPSTSNQDQQQEWSPPVGQPPVQAAYYDPNPPSNNIATNSRSRPPPSQTTAVVQGYDMTSPPTSTSPSPPPTQPQAPTIQRQPSPIITPAPSTIDAGKLGLLPKRPVSLLPDPNPIAGSSSTGGPTPSSAGTATINTSHERHDDDYNSDDGLEYAENPFEDSTGKK